MPITPKILIDKCLEIEGLLALLIQRDKGDISEEIFQLIEDKAETLYMEVGELRYYLQEQPIIEKNPMINDEPKENPDEINKSEVSCCYDSDTEFAEIKVDYSDLNDSKIVEVEEEPQSTQDRQCQNEVQNEIKDCDNELILSLEHNNNNQTIENVAAPLSPTIEEHKSIDAINDDLPSISFQIKLSLNDIYRFRRELFNFSDEEMEEALDALSGMTSKEEVEDFFYNDLCWEPDDEVVREFMSMIKTVKNP